MSHLRSTFCILKMLYVPLVFSKSLHKKRKKYVCDLYSEGYDTGHITYIYFLYNCPLGKCWTQLTEETVWDKDLAMAPVIIHPSKEPDGEGKVSVQILFLD